MGKLLLAAAAICAGIGAGIGWLTFGGLGLAAAIVLFGAFVLQGIWLVPAEPPHVAVVTIWGERVKKLRKEGFVFFPLRGLWYDGILVGVRKVNQDLEPQKVRTPDLAELLVPVSLTWTPGAPKDSKGEKQAEFLINYLNAGGETGVRNILKDIVRERLREWAIAAHEGPKTWEAAIKSQDEATKVLLKEIAGEEVATDVARIRRGDGVQPVSQLGITLNRLNVGEIEPLGELAKAAELQVKEERDRVAEVFEIDTELQQARSLQNALRAEGKEVNILEAWRIVKEYKTAREGRGFVLPGIPEAIRDAVGAFFGGRGGSHA